MKGKDIFLEQAIRMAFMELYTHDDYLIYNRPKDISFSIISSDNLINEQNSKYYVGERAIVFRFAHYLQNLIQDYYKEYDLDCEYNRNGTKAKNLPGFPYGTFPDMIIHKRKSNKHNLLIMEFKPYWNNHQNDDIEKIKKFVSDTGEYKYKYGASVLIEKHQVIINWVDNMGKVTEYTLSITK